MRREYPLIYKVPLLTLVLQYHGVGDMYVEASTRVHLLVASANRGAMVEEDHDQCFRKRSLVGLEYST